MAASASARGGDASLEEEPTAQHEKQQPSDTEGCLPASSASTRMTDSGPELDASDGIRYVQYEGEQQLQGIIDLISVDLSEPYSIFTYRYFINQWPNLCFVALHKSTHGSDSNLPPKEGVTGVTAGSSHCEEQVVGAIVCKADRHRSGTMRGYIAMLAVHHSMRKRGMGSKLVQLAVRAMRSTCDEAVLETEVTNTGALRLYETLGFVRDKRLSRYYLNGNDAFRLKVWFPPKLPPDLAPNAEAQQFRPHEAQAFEAAS